MTALDQNLGGARDWDIASICRREGRTIVTLDRGFAAIRAYPPSAYPGLVVFRTSARSRKRIQILVARLVKVLSSATLASQVWIFEDSRIQLRQ